MIGSCHSVLMLSCLAGKTERSQLEGKELTRVSLNILHAASGKTLHMRGTGVSMCHADGEGMKEQIQ